MSDLRISADLSLPVDAMTEAIAILATRGRGKTNLATVFAEEILSQRQQVVIVDPVGIYWGLRSSADGKSEGYRILVLGGEHGDLPLQTADAGAIAGFLVEKEASAVLDLSAFPSKGEQTRFLEVFFDRLWHLKAGHRSPMLLVLEEAQEVAPQKPREKEQIMLGRIERIAKLGRNYGIGLLMITQRPASLNKDVLNLAGVLILLGIVAPIERKAAMDWIGAHEVQAQANEVLASLAKLPVGDAWLWWPLRDILTRFHVRKRTTFDSSATPKVGEKRLEPGRRAEVDLEAFKGELSGLIEKAKADDPRELRKRIQELEAQLKKAVSIQPRIEIQERIVEVPYLPMDEVRAWLKRIREDVTGSLDAVLEDAAATAQRLIENRPAQPKGRTPRTAAAVQPPVSNSVVKPVARPTVSSTVTGEVDRSERKILDALAWLEAVGFDSGSRIQVAFLGGYRPSGGRFMNLLGGLRTNGMIDYPSGGYVALTDAGRRHARVPDIDRTPAGLQEAVYERLPASERRVLEAIVSAYPRALPRAAVAASTGYEETGGRFMNILGGLRSLGLVDYPHPGHVRAASLLFLE